MAADVGSYLIVNGDSDTKLMEVVNDHIGHGWRPIGGPIAVLDAQGGMRLLQALVHPEWNQDRLP